ncbi:hypothetical protein BC832DRAFT_138497 [Gaertneriomyces semiglobifer]|nr:hypothetical protein BC832DRAFT_138497 [Gaertneriomyces semiglobifer]
MSSYFLQLSASVHGFFATSRMDPAAAHGTSISASAPSARRKTHTSALQKGLEDKMLREFEGLTRDQRLAVLKVVEENDKMRRRVVFGEAEDSYGYGDEDSSFDADDYEFEIQANPSPCVGEARPMRLSSTARPLSPAERPTPSPENSLRSRYGQLIHRPIPTASGISNHTLSGSTLDTTMSQMHATTQNLQKWVEEVLEAPVNFLPPEENGGKVSGEASGNGSGQAKEQKDSDSDTGEGFSVLLSASKPSILESKPSRRLRIMRETNPPESLRTMTGREPAEGIKRRERRVRGPEGPRREGIKNEKRFKYGAYWVRPDRWEEYVKKEEEESRKKAFIITPTPHYTSIVQQKLEDITQKRAREESALLAALNTSLNADSTSPMRKFQSSKSLHGSGGTLSRSQAGSRHGSGLDRRAGGDLGDVDDELHDVVEPTLRRPTSGRRAVY